MWACNICHAKINDLKRRFGQLTKVHWFKKLLTGKERSKHIAYNDQSTMVLSKGAVYLQTCFYTSICPLRSVTAHVTNLCASPTSLWLPAFPLAKSKSRKVPWPNRLGGTKTFGRLISRQWYLRIWFRGCKPGIVRFKLTQKGSIRKWTFEDNQTL